MKKGISVLLAALMILSLFSLAACSKKDTTSDPASDTSSSSDTSSPASTNPAGTDTGTVPAEETAEEKAARLENSKPNEYVQEKLDAGMEVLIGDCEIQMDDQFSVMKANRQQERMNELGFNYQISNANSDSAVQLQQIENYVQMGAALVFAFVWNLDAYADFAPRYEELGTYLCLAGGVAEFHVSGAVYSAIEEVAQGQCEMAIKWLDEQYPDAAPGSIHTAVVKNVRTDDNVKRSQCMVDYISQDPRVDVVYMEENAYSLDAAFTSATDVLTFDPSIRLVLTFTTTQALGYNNYITSLSGADLSEYAIFSAGIDSAVNELIDLAGAGDPASVIRGSLCFGYADPSESYVKLFTEMLLGNVETPYILWDPMYAYTYLDYTYTGDYAL